MRQTVAGVSELAVLLQKIINFAGLTAREQPPPDDTHRKYLANFRDRKARGQRPPVISCLTMSIALSLTAPQASSGRNVLKA